MVDLASILPDLAPESPIIRGLVIGLLWGLVLGGLYFGSLWWTVQRLPDATHPHRWFWASVGVRVTVVLPSFLAVVYIGNALVLLSALLGFAHARWIAVRWARRASS